MLVKVYVTLKPGVLDPQGMAIQRALETMGWSEATEVRQGKYFEIQWQGDLKDADQRSRMESVASRVLSNPLIESYRIEWPKAGAA